MQQSKLCRDNIIYKYNKLPHNMRLFPLTKEDKIYLERLERL